MNDREIIALFLQRDESAIWHTSQKYGNRLRRLSHQIVQDFQTAEECENDTYRAAWNSIPPNEPNDYFYPFLARIIRHLSLNCCRNRSRLKRNVHICELYAEMEQCIPAPNDCECQIADIEFKDTINRFLASLDAEKRNIFLRRYWYLDSICDISKRFGLSESKVKTTLFRTRNKLRDYLKREGYSL